MAETVSRVEELAALKIKRRMRGVVSQRQLASYMGLDASTLSNKLSNRRKITLEDIYLAAEALGIHPFHLLPRPEELEEDNARQDARGR